MRIKMILFCIVVITIFAFIGNLAFSGCLNYRDFRNYVELGSDYLDYKKWVKNGGRFSSSYMLSLASDISSGSHVVGLSKDEILKKYMGLIHGEKYNKGSYRDDFINQSNESEHSAFLRSYIFLNGTENDFGWAIELRNGKAVSFVLIKG